MVFCFKWIWDRGAGDLFLFYRWCSGGSSFAGRYLYKIGSEYLYKLYVGIWGKEACDQCISVLGTKFNVRSYPSDTVFITTLLEGSVKFVASNFESGKVLRPGEQLKYNRSNTQVEISVVDTDEVVSWLNNYYTFQPQSLKEILARMSHVYDVTFECHDTTIVNKSFRGTFYQGQDLSDFLDVIGLATNLKYEKQDGKIVLYKE